MNCVVKSQPVFPFLIGKSLQDEDYGLYLSLLLRVKPVKADNSSHNSRQRQLLQNNGLIKTKMFGE